MFCAAVAASYRVWSFLFWNVAMQVPCSVSKTVQKVSSLAALATALPTSRTIYERKYPALAASLYVCVCVWFTFFTFLLNDISFFSLRQNSYLLYIFVIRNFGVVFFQCIFVSLFSVSAIFVSSLKNFIHFFLSSFIPFIILYFDDMPVAVMLLWLLFFISLFSFSFIYIDHTAIPHYWYDSYFWFSA